MTLLLWAGCLAIFIGIILLVKGMGNSQVKIGYLGWTINGQAWLVTLLIGFGLILMEVYLYR